MLQRFCICLGLLLVSFSSYPAKAVEKNNSQRSVIKDTELVWSLILEECGLKALWQKNLFFKEGENAGRMFVEGKRLFVETDRNYLYCLDRKNGKIAFGLPLADTGLPIQGPSFFKNQMLFMVGSRLHILDMKMGRITESRDYSFVGKGAVYSPVRNDKFIYISDSTARLNAVTADQMSVVFPVTSDDDTLINSIVADNDHLVFSSVSGGIYRIGTKRPKRIWKFNTGRLAAPLVRDGRWLYVSSLDRKIYKLNLDDGSSGWLAGFIAGEPLTTSARVGDKVIYQYAGKKGLFAVDKESGKKRWQLKEGIDLLCEKGSKAYAIASPARLVVMDNKKGKKLYSVNFANVTDYAFNDEDSTIYVADENGNVMAIVIDK